MQALSNAFLDIKTAVAIDNSRNKLRLTNFFKIIIYPGADNVSSVQNIILIPMEWNFNFFLTKNV